MTEDQRKSVFRKSVESFGKCWKRSIVESLKTENEHFSTFLNQTFNSLEPAYLAPPPVAVDESPCTVVVHRLSTDEPQMECCWPTNSHR